MEQRKQAIIDALSKFMHQRSGMDPQNYGDYASYRSEQRSVTRDLHHARTLLGAVSWRDSITADDLIAASKRAYSGRLTIVEDSGRVRIEYCTGQYFPTEYRRAVCAVLAAALWDYTRTSAMPDDATLESIKQSPGTWLREHFRREFGRTISNRWFD